MLRRPPLVWKVNGIFLAIMVAVLAVSAGVTAWLHEYAAVESARDLSRVSFNIILQDIRELMVRGEPSSVGALIEQLAGDRTVFRDIRLIGHDGRVMASTLDPVGIVIGQDSWPCSHCHGAAGLQNDSTIELFDEIVEFRDGERAISVVMPTFASAGCRTVGCHTDSGEAPPVLGVMQADFTLRGVENHIAQSARDIILALLVSIVLGAVATWWATDRLVGRRLRALREGAQHIADRDFSFKFGQTARSDRISQVEGILNDVTSELSLTISELTNTKEYLQGIVESSADIIITVDPDGRIMTFNRGAEEVLGYDRSDVVGKHIETLFADPRERDIAIAQLRHTDNVVNYQTHFLTKDGDVRDVILTLSRLRTPDGIAIGTFGISKDITRELHLQRELLRSARMAALGQALTGIQHSMKNMLNVLKGGSYMVKTALAKDDRQMLVEGWEMVQEGIAHMTEMSKSMLDFARERQLDLEPTDLGGLAKRILTMNNGKFKEQGVTLELEIEPNLPMVRCDPELIHSVVVDLLSNALYACSEKQYRREETPTVTLEVQRRELDGYVTIVVSDNAEGMPEEVRRKVFTPFFSTKKKKGTGMGLAVVARIVSSHGGQTRVESEPGLGSTFEVLLPITGPSVSEEGADV